MKLKGTEIAEWAANLDTNGDRCRMTSNNAIMFIQILTISMGPDAKNFESSLENNLGADKILKSRFETFGYKMSNTVTSLVCCLINTLSPGNLVMYANYLAYKCKVNNWDELTVDNICSDLFPYGGFTDESLNEAWQNQKIDGANLLDMSSAGKSIQKI